MVRLPRKCVVSERAFCGAGKTLEMLHKALWRPVPTRKTQFRTMETESRPPAGETSLNSPCNRDSWGLQSRHRGIVQWTGNDYKRGHQEGGPWLMQARDQILRREKEKLDQILKA